MTRLKATSSLKSYSGYIHIYIFLIIEKGKGEMSGNRVREMNFRETNTGGGS